MYTLENDKCKLTFTRTKSNRFQDKYDVTLVSGEWPTEPDLLNICDNKCFGSATCHFGGSVYFKSKTEAIVTVHID